MVEYPEHEKLKLVKNKSQAIGEFLEWLQEQGVVLCKWSPSEHAEGDFFPAYLSIEKRLAQYFSIDLNKIETEKRQMLEALLESNASST